MLRTGLATTASSNAKSYTIDILNMSGVDRYILGNFLAQNFQAKVTAFSASVNYTFPHIDLGRLRSRFPLSAVSLNYNSLSLTCGLDIRPTGHPVGKRRFPDDYCYDVKNGKLFLEGRYGQREEIIGALKFDSYDGSVNFEKEIIYTFNPETILEPESKLIGAFLDLDFSRSQNKEKMIPAYSPSTLINLPAGAGGIYPQFVLSRSLLRRRHENAPKAEYAVYPRDYCYEIVDEAGITGEGAFSTIKKIEINLLPQADFTLVRKVINPRIGKVMGLSHKNSMVRAEVDHEHFIAALITGSRAKHPIFFSANSYSMLVMRHVPGNDVKKFIENDRKDLSKKVNNFSIERRLEMAIACLMALRRVHYKKIVHRDIKPQNIVINLNADPISAELIDFGLSATLAEADMSRVGTPLYASPEYYENVTFKPNGDLLSVSKKLSKPLSQKADVFNMAWVIAQIFRADDNPSMTHLDAKNYADACRFTNLFTGLDINGKEGLDTVALNNIRHCLELMTRKNVDDRCTVDTVLESFELLLLKTKLSKIKSPEILKDRENAFRSGIAMRSIMNDMINTQQKAAIFDATSIYTEFTACLHYISDTEEAIQEFIARMDVKFLHGLSDRKKVKEKVQDALLEYDTNIRQIRIAEMWLKRQLDLPQDAGNKRRLERLASMASDQMAKSRVQLTLDDIKLLGHQYGKYVMQFADEIRSLGLLDDFYRMHAYLPAGPGVR